MNEGSTRRGFLKHGFRGALAMGLGVGFYNTSSHGVELTEVKVQLAGLPEPFRGLKIGHVSDLHASMIANQGLFKEAARLLMSSRPDVIVFTGDYVTGSTKFLSAAIGEYNREYLDQLVAEFSNIQAPLGVFGVLGNHDFWSGSKAVAEISAEFRRKMGVRWLRNTSQKIERDGAHINILGVDDYWQSSCSLHNAYSGLGKDSVNILLSHNPDINDDVLPQMKVDLILSGHTHGGQVVLPWIGCPVVPSKFGQKYLSGLVKDGDRQTYITRGVGHLMAPIRLNCPPEVTILTLA